MSPFEILVNSGLMCWSTIYFGLQKGWVGRGDVYKYAIGQLGSGCEDEGVAVIAGGEYLADDEFISLVFKQANISGCIEELDKWRLAFLVAIELSRDSDEQKLNKLQEVYAEFNYPEDMSSCSVYSQDNVSPLVAMKQIIGRLKEKFSFK